jgi:glycosyltransferase involved in cell wall biosynthesis
LASYASIAEELEILVFGVGERKEKKIAPNVRVFSGGGTSKVSAYIRGVRELFSSTKHTHPDIISAQDPFFVGFAALVAARVYRVPFQAQLHTDCFSFAYALQSPRQCIETVLAFFVVQGASCIRVVSKRILKSISSFSRIPVAVLPIRVADVPQDPGQKPLEFKDRFTLVSVARMTEEKQLHLLVNAVLGIPNVDVIFVGDGPLRKDLELRVARLGLTDRVRFAGWQNPHPYYAHADAYVCTSRFEGYGMALMEGALHALPIVTTDVGIASEVLHDGEEALIVEPTAQAIRKALEKLLTDSALRASLGDAARKSATGLLVSEGEYLARYRQGLLTCASKTAS